MLLKWGGVCRFCRVDVEDPVDDCGFAVLAFGLLSQKKTWQWKSGRVGEVGGTLREGGSLGGVCASRPFSQSSATWDILGLGFGQALGNFCSLER